MKIFLTLVMLMAFAAGGAVIAEDAPGLPPWMVKPGEIVATLTPDKSSIMAGEPVCATLTLENKSGRDLWITPSAQFGGLWEQQRDSIHLTAVDKQGRKAAAFPWAGPFGSAYDGWDGSGPERKFTASGKLVFRVCVTGWVVLDRPGTYTLSVAQVVFALKLKHDPPRRETHAGAERVVVPAQATIEVTPADRSKMAAVIDGLVKTASAGSDGPASEAVQMLETASDAQVIPWLCSRAKSRNDLGMMETGLRGLMRFKEDAALDGMKQALKAVETDDSSARAACEFILHSADPGAVKWLQAQENAKCETVADYAKASKGITATLVPEKRAMLPGEPIYASFILKNNSDEEVTVDLHDDSETQHGGDPETQSGGAEWNIKLTAADKDGAKVPPVSFPPEAALAVESHGMPVWTPVKLAAGGSHEFKLFMPWRLALEKAGNYTLAANCTLQLCYKDEGEPTVVISVRTSAPLEVLQKDNGKMGNLVDGLVQRASQKPKAQDAKDAAFRLRWISDERVIPYFKQMTNSQNADDRVIAMAALAKFNNDEALDCLKKGLEIVALPDAVSRQRDNLALTDLHDAAFRGLIHSAHPGAIRYLMSRRKDLQSDMRLELMDAVAKLPAKEAVPMLRQMQDDPYGWVAEHSGEYLSEIAAGIPMASPEDDGDQE